MAWGKAVAVAGWGTFELLHYDPASQQATVVVHNPWELRMQRNLPMEKRWGCPFLQGKIIGIFSHAFKSPCWAEDDCYYDSDNPHVTFQINPSSTTIPREIKKLRQARMQSRERALAEEVERKTAELKKAQSDIEEYSRSLELKVSERTAELQSILKLLQQRTKELNELIEESPIAIFTSTPDGKLLRSNKVLLSFFGFSSLEEVLAKNVSLGAYYVNSEDRDKLVEELLTNGKVSKKEVRYKFPEKDGWLQLSMRKVQKKTAISNLKVLPKT